MKFLRRYYTPKKIFASDSRFTFTIKGYGKALDKPSPIVPPKSSTPKSSPEPMNSKKARIEPEPEPNESPKIATKVRKVKVKGAEPSRKSSRKAK